MLQKIDDFDASSQGQQAGPCCATETMPEWAGEIARRELAPKGRFYGAHEFCNCLNGITAFKAANAYEALEQKFGKDRLQHLQGL